MRSKPVNLNLFTIKFPITAVASILHRMSGVILFLLIPCFLGMLSNLLYFPEEFVVLRDQLINTNLNKIILWFGLSAFFYHLLAGIRHLLSDMGIGESIYIARISAQLVIVLSVILSILIGLRLC